MNNSSNSVATKFEFVPIFKKTLLKIQQIYKQFKNSVTFRSQIILLSHKNLSQNELRKIVEEQCKLCYLEFEKNALFAKDYQIAKQLKKLKQTRNLTTVTQEFNTQITFRDQILDKIDNPVEEQPFPFDAG